MPNSSSLWSSVAGIKSLVTNRGPKPTAPQPQRSTPLSYLDKAKEVLTKAPIKSTTAAPVSKPSASKVSTAKLSTTRYPALLTQSQTNKVAAWKANKATRVGRAALNRSVR